MSAREERLLTPETIAAVDQWLDDADVFAKGYWQYVNGKLITVGLRIGQDWNKVVAFFGDTIVRHEDGSHTVLSAKDAAELAALQARVAELEALPSRAAVLREAADAIVADNDRQLWATKPGKHWAADLLRRMADGKPPRQPEDPHDGPLHHDYALGRDLPTIPHQQDRRAL